MDLVEGEEPVRLPPYSTNAAWSDGSTPRHLGQIDISLDLLSVLGLEIELFDPVTLDDDDPGFLRWAASISILSAMKSQLRDPRRPGLHDLAGRPWARREGSAMVRSGRAGPSSPMQRQPARGAEHRHRRELYAESTRERPATVDGRLRSRRGRELGGSAFLSSPAERPVSV